MVLYQIHVISITDNEMNFNLRIFQQLVFCILLKLGKFCLCMVVLVVLWCSAIRGKA